MFGAKEVCEGSISRDARLQSASDSGNVTLLFADHRRESSVGHRQVV